MSVDKFRQSAKHFSAKFEKGMEVVVGRGHVKVWKALLNISNFESNWSQDLLSSVDHFIYSGVSLPISSCLPNRIG